MSGVFRWNVLLSTPGSRARREWRMTAVNRIRGPFQRPDRTREKETTADYPKCAAESLAGTNVQDEVYRWERPVENTVTTTTQGRSRWTRCAKESNPPIHCGETIGRNVFGGTVSMSGKPKKKRYVIVVRQPDRFCTIFGVEKCSSREMWSSLSN